MSLSPFSFTLSYHRLNAKNGVGSIQIPFKGHVHSSTTTLLSASFLLESIFESLVRANMAKDLHVMWEHGANIRERSRNERSLLAWPAPEVRGHATKKAFVMNKKVMELIAIWWGGQSDLPQTVPVGMMRNEVGKGVF